ncbi:MAG: PPOX class F420-dependent oxidoreductase [Acidimicrobiales bacterium]|jgi:hypothetical protein|nr:PPOX class F420-dependent oxidoreductase [Acidimicrobiales bacterium]
MVTSAPLAALDREAYVCLVTFRRDGRAVPTPVWFAADGDDLVVVTEPTSGKVKRLRNDPRVTVQPCDVRGRVHGTVHDGQARVLGGGDAERARVVLNRKYGLQKRVLDLASTVQGLLGRRHDPVYLAVRLESGGSPGA